MSKILIIDDDTALTKALGSILARAGYDSIAAHTAEDGLSLALGDAPDLVLLDVMVPNMGGWEVCRRLRQASDVPVIFLTALGNVEDVVQGLEIGGDDYMVKPFEEVEVLARIKAHLRRAASATTTPSDRFVFSNGDLVVDIPARIVTAYGKTVDLTPREFELLTMLVQNAGKVVTTHDLVRKAWGMTEQHATENIKPYIHYLRRKLEKDPTSPRWVTTVRGVGYRLTVE